MCLGFSFAPSVWSPERMLLPSWLRPPLPRHSAQCSSTSSTSPSGGLQGLGAFPLACAPLQRDWPRPRLDCLGRMIFSKSLICLIRQQRMLICGCLGAPARRARESCPLRLANLLPGGHVFPFPMSPPTLDAARRFGFCLSNEFQAL